MKLATFSSGGEQRVGAVIDDGRRIVDLSGAFSDMLALIEAGDAGRDSAAEIVADPPPGAVVDLAAVRLAAPLPRPPQIRDFLCFEEHLRNSFAQAERMTGRKFEIPAVWYEQPIYYKANRFSVIGPDEEIRWPGYADVLDYELELACVIGRPGVDISRDDAAAHIFGYTIFNDVSARDAQLREMAGQLGPAKGKDFDTGNIWHDAPPLRGRHRLRQPFRDPPPRRDPRLGHGRHGLRPGTWPLPLPRRHHRARDRPHRRPAEPDRPVMRPAR
jgi:2-keto-4-pentenoate hydratase/2-oxohepta-3-ene-1,7-dioic acid hydratase in catechol pathway